MTDQGQRYRRCWTMHSNYSRCYADPDTLLLAAAILQSGDRLAKRSPSSGVTWMQ